MAEFYVKNSLNDSKAVKFNITLRYFVLLHARGDHKWVLEIGTTHLDKDGNSIPAKKIYLISLDNVDEIIEQAVSEMCESIDWSPFVEDKKPPYVFSYFPNTQNVGIESSVNIILKEVLPSAGIDLSSLKIILNNGMVNLDITSEAIITGDPYEYELKWSPTIRVYDTYD